ncbi:MAG TPA: hypothetical protein VNF71_16715 [Acidimicrobiales bacterium]|nr:hypothetical protein [Acidimicrobiales bacterium]
MSETPLPPAGNPEEAEGGPEPGAPAGGRGSAESWGGSGESWGSWGAGASEAGPGSGAPAGGWSSAPSGPWGGGSAGPGFAPPDPAAVAGPPWPELIAVGPYTPPRMIRWPIIGGLVLVVVYVVVIVIFSSSTSISHAAWLADHEGTINTLNRDQQNLAADNPAQGGNAAQWIADWQALHQDAAAAAGLPNPGGSATAPWREMINDYFNGSSEIIQAVQTHDQSLLLQAQRDLVAGDRAAAAFNKAMGINSP